MNEYFGLLRVLAALVLGICIGIERRMRYKEAGLRTHGIVCAGAALIMLVSKYGFSDVAEYDASRVAAQIVSGIGFLGAGMILYKRQALQGLTTAAGIWMTAGIGMAVGAGLYIIGVGAAVLMIAFQFLLHLPLPAFQTKQYQIIKIRFEGGAEEHDRVRELFGVREFLKYNVAKEGDKILNSATVRVDTKLVDQLILKALKEEPFILSIEREEEK